MSEVVTASFINDSTIEKGHNIEQNDNSIECFLLNVFQKREGILDR